MESKGDRKRKTVSLAIALLLAAFVVTFPISYLVLNDLSLLEWFFKKCERKQLHQNALNKPTTSAAPVDIYHSTPQPPLVVSSTKLSVKSSPESFSSKTPHGLTTADSVVTVNIVEFVESNKTHLASSLGTSKKCSSNNCSLDEPAHGPILVPRPSPPTFPTSLPPITTSEDRLSSSTPAASASAPTSAVPRERNIGSSSVTSTPMTMLLSSTFATSTSPPSYTVVQENTNDLILAKLPLVNSTRLPSSPAVTSESPVTSAVPQKYAGDSIPAIFLPGSHSGKHSHGGLKTKTITTMKASTTTSPTATAAATATAINGHSATTGQPETIRDLDSQTHNAGLSTSLQANKHEEVSQHFPDSSATPAAQNTIPPRAEKAVKHDSSITHRNGSANTDQKLNRKNFPVHVKGQVNRTADRQPTGDGSVDPTTLPAAAVFNGFPGMTNLVKEAIPEVRMTTTAVSSTSRPTKIVAKQKILGKTEEKTKGTRDKNELFPSQKMPSAVNPWATGLPTKVTKVSTSTQATMATSTEVYRNKPVEPITIPHATQGTPAYQKTSTASTTTGEHPEQEVHQKHHPHHHRHHHHLHYGTNSAVVVTALFDIGRGDWIKYTRSYDHYLQYMEKLLRLRNRLVIYTDSRGAEFVRRKRHHGNTEVFEMSMEQLPLYRYREEMRQIIEYEQGNWKYDHAMKDHPEAKSVDYDIIVNSKPFFIYNATQSSRFKKNARYFTWIDAGYGHGDASVIPPNCHWKPPLPDGFMTVIKITPEYDKVERYSISDLYRVDWSVISGGFFGGDIEAINRFYRFYHKTFFDLLDERKVDDDQTILTLMLKNYASLFFTIHSDGNWFALFSYFPC